MIFNNLLSACAIKYVPLYLPHPVLSPFVEYPDG